MNIRAFKLEDLDTMRMWLEQDYIRMFWGDPQDWINEISENLNTHWVKYFIVENNSPIGFLQYYETDKAPQGDWSVEPDGTVGIDYLIGNKEFLGKGYGTVIVKLFVEYIKAIKKYNFIIADPVKENISSIKVLTNNGFELHDNGLYKLKIESPNEF